jgi:hypothetical protein
VSAKHARPEPGEASASATQDRAQLLAALNAQAATLAGARRPRWRVVRQYVDMLEQPVCAHRWGWVADLCAYRRTARHADEVGVFYTVRRAAS